MLAANGSVAEALYPPVFVGTRVGGFHDTSLQSNMKCDVYICKGLYAMSRCHVARPPVIIERTTKEQTVLSHPLQDSFLMSFSFTKLVLAQLDFLRWKENEACKTDVCFLPGQLEEKVARLHFLALGANSDQSNSEDCFFQYASLTTRR